MLAGLLLRASVAHEVSSCTDVKAADSEAPGCGKVNNRQIMCMALSFGKLQMKDPVQVTHKQFNVCKAGVWQTSHVNLVHHLHWLR